MKNLLTVLLFVLILPGGAVAQTTKPSQTLPQKAVKLALHWYPQAQFAGYYMALEKGLYRQYGLDMHIFAKDPQYSTAELLKERKTDFAVMWLSCAINQYDQAGPFVHLAQIIQRSSLMLIAKKSLGIQKPADMNGRKISVWPGDLGWQPRAFLNKYQIKATIIPQSNTVNLFLNDGVDVVSAMYYNEYHTILNSGINEDELSLFFFDNYGLNFPEDGLYTLQEGLLNDPKTTAAFIRASTEGWHYAFDHEDETLTVVLKYMQQASISANRTHQRWMLRKMKDLTLVSVQPAQFGILNPKEYETVAGELKKAGIISQIPDFKKFCRWVKIN